MLLQQVGRLERIARKAAEPCRSAVTGVPRNPTPPRSMFMASNRIKPLSEEQSWLLMGDIARAVHFDRNAKRDYALVRGSYLLCCRVSEIAVIKWEEIEVLSDGGQIHLLGDGRKARTVRVSSYTFELFHALGGGEADS